MYYELGTMVGVMKGASPFSNHEKGISIPSIDVIGEIVAIHPTILSYTVRLSKYFTLVFSEDDIYRLPGWMSDKRYLFHKMLGSVVANAHQFYYVKEFESFVNNYEDQKKGKECIKYDRERPEFLPEYRNIPIGLEQSLNKVHDDMISSLLYSVPTFYMTKDEFKLPTKEEINAMFGVSKFEYKKIIFSPPCTIILWMDGTKTMARTNKEETFDPEKGVAVCFMKRALGETEGKKVLRKANKDFYDEISRIASKQLDEELKKAAFPLPKGVTFRPFNFDKPINNNAVVNIDQSTIDEVKKVEDEEEKNERSN